VWGVGGYLQTQFDEDRLTQFRVIVVTDPQTNKQTHKQINIPSSPDPFPLGLHALPIGLLDRACTQAGPTSSLERRVGKHTFTHAS